MSNPFKAVGKVFKKVIKTVVKIAPFALAAAAVVFTGGAALGLLPTFSAAVGGLVSGLGLSAGITGALTGAITSAGFGSALGFVTGGKKGMKAGFLTGLLSGGVMGAINPGMFGIVKDVAGNVTTTNALAHGGKAFGAAGKGAFNVTVQNGVGTATPKLASGGMLPPSPSSGLLETPSVANNNVDYNGLGQAADKALGQPSSVAGYSPAGGMAPQTVAPSSANMAAQSAGLSASGGGGGGGLGGMLGNNPMLFGQLLQGLGGALGGGDDSWKDKAKAHKEMGEWAYGGVYTGNPDPFGMANMTYAVPQPRYYYDEKTNQVVDRQQQPGG